MSFYWFVCLTYHDGVLMRQNKIPNCPGFRLGPGIGPGVGLRAGEVGSALDVERRDVPPVKAEVPIQVHAHAADTEEILEAEASGLGAGLSPETVCCVRVFVSGKKSRESKDIKNVDVEMKVGHLKQSPVVPALHGGGCILIVD